MRTPNLRAVATCSVLALLASCDSRDAPPVDPGPGPNPPPPPVTLAVERVFPNLTFDSPVAMLQAPGDSTRWFVVEQDGVVRVFDNDPAVEPGDVGVFVNISSFVASPEDGRGPETGLLGMAFHPQFATNQRVFLSFTELSGSTLLSRIAEFRAINNGQELDPFPRQTLIAVTQREDNHNGGNIAFDPLNENFLYIGFGDGGGGGDMHGTIGNGQFLQTLLGKMLRINVSPNTGYIIPSDNLFAGNQQCGDTFTPQQNCPEIFAVGFRNPWRWSLDRSTGELWVGDVGQGTWEEVNLVELGRNYGWRCREGAHPFNANCGDAIDLRDPVAEYTRSAGFSVTGGYVYRGSAIPALQGRYVFGDFGSGRIWHIAGDTQPTLDVTSPTDEAPVLDTSLNISSFAEDNAGELYVVDHGGTLHRLRTP